MAVALLTTLYGALVANLIALPIADKLEIRSIEEGNNRRLIIDGVMAIRDGMSPLALGEILRTYVTGTDRAALDRDEDEDDYEPAEEGPE
jgi:chemotaxis protein MotA